MGNQVVGRLTPCTTISFPSNILQIGAPESFEDRYEIDDSHPIGTGKFSQVFLCSSRDQPEQRYALKVINTLPDDHMSLDMIHEEINILRVLGNHPNIMQLVDVDEVQESNCIRLVTELCDGGELYERIVQKQYYPEADGQTLVRNLLEAVAYIHSKGIMHRDLKPENILLLSKDNDTDIKISDFGLAKMSKDFPNRLPRSDLICGSDFYLAPEVVKQLEYGREIDIWAVGVITYSLLSGSLPFSHSVLHKLYRQIMERDLSFSEPQWSKVSKGAQDFILRLLQIRPGDRLTGEQALKHPWLRGNIGKIGGTTSPANSFHTDSFASQNPSNQENFGSASLQEDSENQYLKDPYSTIRPSQEDSENQYLKDPYSTKNNAAISTYEKGNLELALEFKEEVLEEFKGVALEVLEECKSWDVISHSTLLSLKSGGPKNYFASLGA